MENIKDFEKKYGTCKEISLVRDGVYTTYQKLMKKANPDMIIEGGYDFAASATFGRCGNYAGDFHIEVANQVEKDEDDDMYWFNFDIESVPPTKDLEPIPQESSKPFKFSEGERGAPGMLGKAIRAFGEVKAVMNSHGVPDNNLDEWMGRTWDIDATSLQLLKDNVPEVRSTGSAFWGGYGRKLKPFCFSYMQAQARIRIKHHGVSRAAIASDALVNWPRINAVARIIAGQLMVDDNVAKHLMRGPNFRLDYIIFPYEIPRCPKNIVMPKIPIPEASNVSEHLTNIVASSLSYLKKSYEKFKASAIVKTSNFIHFEGNLHLNPRDVQKLRMKEISADVIVDFNHFMSKMSETDDVMGYYRRAEPPEDYKPTMPVKFLVKDVARAFLNNHPGSWLRASQLRNLMYDLDDIDDRRESLMKLTKYIKNVLSPNFLMIVKTVGNLVKKGLGIDWLGEIALPDQYTHDIFKKADLTNVLTNMLANEPILKSLTKMVIDATKDYEHQHMPTMSDKAFDSMLRTGDVALMINELFIPLKAKWAHRYDQNAIAIKQAGKTGWLRDMVTNQLYAKVFRNLNLSIHDDGDVKPVQMSIAQALLDSARKMIRHRTHIDDSELNYRGYNLQQISDGLLDEFLIKECDYVPDPRYAEVAQNVTNKVQEFANDVSNYIEQLLLHKELRELDLVIDHKKALMIIEDDPVIVEAAVTAPIIHDIQPVIFHKPIQNDLINPLGFGFGDEEDDDFEFEAEVVKQVLDWEMELLEVYQGLEEQIYMRYRGIYPKMVSEDVFKIIVEQVRKVINERTDKKGQIVNIDLGNDFEGLYD